MPDDAEETLLTTAQAGVILGKSAPTVRRLIDLGLLPTAGKLDVGPHGAHILRERDVRAYVTAATPEDAA